MIRSLLSRLRRDGRRERTPTVLQMEAVECGAAALGSILAYHGRVVSLEELRVECGVSRDGVTAANIVRAGRRYGMDARGWKRDLEGLKTMTFPVILFWNFNHFLVLEGWSGDRWFVNDPATGPRSVDREEMNEAFTGMVLTFEPGPAFEEGGEAPSLVGGLRSRLVGSEAAVAFAVLAGLVLVIPGLIIPAFARIFVDKILVAGLEDWVGPLLLGMAITAVLRGAVTWIRQRGLLRLETKLAAAGAGRFFWHVLRLPTSFFSQRWAGEVASRVALTDEVAELLSGRLASTFIDLLMVVFFAAIMLAYDPLLTAVGVTMVSVSLVLMKVVGRQRADGSRRLLQEGGKYTGALMGSLQNIETVKATSRESELFAALAGHQAKLVNAQQDLGGRTIWLTSTPPMLNAVTQAAILGLGGLRVMQGELTMGMLVAFQSLMTSFMAPASSMVDLGARLQELEGGMNRLDDVLRHPLVPRLVEDPEGAGAAGSAKAAGSTAAPDAAATTGTAAAATGPGPDAADGATSVAGSAPPTAPALHTSARLSGRVEIRGVTFGYSRLAPPLIENFDLTLEPGARVALVGASGSGKSTVSKLVCRLYDPWEGEILYDGKRGDELPAEVLSSSLAFVDQDLSLFEGTVRDNLSLWDATIPESALVRAARDAEIHDDIVARPGGYDAPLGEGGVNMSGGQRQRLDIARALAGDPRILVLDEATSALDTVTEEAIDEHIRSRGCTCLIVAHRLSTIRDADEILVLDRGDVVQRGTHDRLMADAEGLYARLVEH